MPTLKSCIMHVKLESNFFFSLSSFILDGRNQIIIFVVIHQ